MLSTIDVVDTVSGDREVTIRMSFPRKDDEVLLAQLADENVKYLNFTTWAQQKNTDLISEINSRGLGRQLYAEFVNPNDSEETIYLPLSGGVKISAINPAWQVAENKRKAEEAKAKAENTSGMKAAETEKAKRRKALQDEADKLAAALAAL